MSIMSAFVALFLILVLAGPVQAGNPPEKGGTAPAISLPAIAVDAPSPTAAPSEPAMEKASALPSSNPPEKSQRPAMKGSGEDGTWLDEAEAGSPRDKAYRKNFFRQISLTIFSLVIITILIVVVMRFLYSKQGILPVLPVQSKFIRIIERQVLQPQKALYLVEIAGKYALIGITESKIEYIMEVDGEKVREKTAEIEASKPSAFDEKYLPKHLSLLLGWMKAKK
jgi:flagellar biogenesis protein FliO